MNDLLSSCVGSLFKLIDCHLIGLLDFHIDHQSSILRRVIKLTDGNENIKLT